MVTESPSNPYATKKVTPPNRVVLIDAGYFIGRQTRWWRPKAGPRYRWAKYKNNPTGATLASFRRACAKELNKDLGFLKFRINQMGFGSKSAAHGTEIIVCYDGVKGKLGRLDEFVAYKAHRNANSEWKSEDGSIPDLRTSFTEYGYNPDQLIANKAGTWGWGSCYSEYDEADDCLAKEVARILADKTNYPDPRILIITSDQDIWQLWGGKTSGSNSKLSDPFNYPEVLKIHNMGRLIDFDAELKTLDIPSWSLYPDHKAITGDPSDNIPGCPETGAKRASALINTYGGLEAIPEEYLTIAFVADPDYISEKLEAWRTENNYTYKYCIENYGNYFHGLLKKNILKIHGEDYEAVKDIVDNKGFIITNYKEDCITYKRIITLPFNRFG